MKLYKLLKDTPDLKVGTVFEERINIFGIKSLINEDLNYQFVVEKIDNFDDWFAELPKEYKRRRVRYGGEYYYLSDDGTISYSEDYRDTEDDYRYNTGIYGRTEEELEAKREYDIARQILLDDAEGGKFIPGKENWSSVYDDTDHLWRSQYYYLYHQGGICFRDKKSIKKSLEEHMEQWEIVRKYEMGEM